MKNWELTKDDFSWNKNCFLDINVNVGVDEYDGFSGNSSGCRHMMIVQLQCISMMVKVKYRLVWKCV